MHPALQHPLRFQPFLRPMVWGGRAIGRFLGKNLPTPEAYGESWEVSDHPLHVSRLATGSLYGHTLRELMERHRAELLGPAAERFDRFPWLIKLLDAEDLLSVQVHPDETAVKKLLPGEGAKTEAWYILDTSPGSRIWAGLKPGVGEPELRAALAAGKVADCLHTFEPKPGDLVFLPAGTVHAVGGGVLMAEVQQTSDATFRLYDWDRLGTDGKPRALHIDQALACIDWTRGPVEPVHAPALRTPYFTIERLRAESTLTLGGTGRLQALIVAEGHGRLDNGDFWLAGDAWLLPAALPPTAFHVERPLAGLVCELP